VQQRRMSSSPIRVLVVDDERLARQRLCALLRPEPDIEVVGECANGVEALDAITNWNPELVFLDVQMPDLDGLGVITSLAANETPEVIFVTAHSAYMERAFELHAIDYLRKPYPNARFVSALTHARRRIHARRAERAPRSDSTRAASQPRAHYNPAIAALQDANTDPRIALQDGRTGTWHIVNRDDIDWLGADGSARVLVHIGKEAYLWRKTLSELEHALDPKVFLRIHRSYIVNAGHIRQVKPLLKGEFAIILADGTVLDTGRTYRAVVEEFLRARAQYVAAVNEDL
jgi:two-component system LytT family response regulator